MNVHPRHVFTRQQEEVVSCSDKFPKACCIRLGPAVCGSSLGLLSITIATSRRVEGGQSFFFQDIGLKSGYVMMKRYDKHDMIRRRDAYDRTAATTTLPQTIRGRRS